MTNHAGLHTLINKMQPTEKEITKYDKKIRTQSRAQSKLVLPVTGCYTLPRAKTSPRQQVCTFL